MSRGIEWWDRWFLGMAEYVATASKDPSTKVGAIIVDPQRRIVSTGYNGLPQGVEDTDERLNNREIKYSMIIHGERNALLFAGRSVAGCTLYTIPFLPCAACASMVIQAGIKRVVSPYSDNPRWVENFKLTEQLFTEAGVEFTVLRDV